MNPKIAIYVSGGVIQGIRSNMKDLNVEIVDSDNAEIVENEFEDRWDQLRTELEFGNY